MGQQLKVGVGLKGCCWISKGSNEGVGVGVGKGKGGELDRTTILGGVQGRADEGG